MEFSMEFIWIIEHKWNVEVHKSSRKNHPSEGKKTLMQDACGEIRAQTTSLHMRSMTLQRATAVFAEEPNPNAPHESLVTQRARCTVTSLSWLLVDLPLWKMMEFANGKDDIPYIYIYSMENKGHVWNHQPDIVSPLLTNINHNQ